jgi:tetratricopeptide (TPR) repeat protein
MRLSTDRDRRRPFHLVLEDLAPARRLLFASNPPARACASDVQALVKKSFDLRYSDIPSMYHYAKLACSLADALPKSDRETQDAKGEAWLQLGNAFRILGHLQSSQRAFAKAESELSKGTQRPDLMALLWELRGALFRDWRKFPLAEKCLAQAVNFHSQAGEQAGLSRCFITRALCAGEGSDPERAVRFAERAVRRIDPITRPDLAVAAVHVMCWFLVDTGHPMLALECSVEAEPLFAQADELVELRRTWLRAHIDHALGLHPSAEILYRRAAEGFAKHEIAYERALVLLDLCLPLAAQHRLDELAAVAAEILPEFERIGIGREATASRLLLSAATRATLAERLEGLDKVSRLVQRALPPPRQLPKL